MPHVNYWGAEMMQILDIEDTAALVFFLSSWVIYARYTARQKSKPSLLSITNQYRLQWMRQMLKRDNRSVDAIMLGNLMRSVTFSANTTILILAGLIGMLSHFEQIGGLLSTLPFAKPMTPMMWEVKILLMVMIFIYAYFKYTWSMRQQNYTSIMVAAAPLDTELTAEHNSYATKTAFLASKAAEHFNNGLRAYYFGLAALAWFIHPLLFMLATAFVVMVLYRREFRSQTLSYLTGNA